MANSAHAKGNSESRLNPFLEKIVDLGCQAASSVSEMVDNAACAVGNAADKVTASAGAGLAGLGDKISSATPSEGLFGHASQSVADTLKAGGDYLQDAKLQGALDDLSGVIKRNPLQSLLISFGAGLLLARALKR